MHYQIRLLHIVYDSEIHKSNQIKLCCIHASLSSDPKAGPKEEEEEEIIRCLCGLFNDEGLMIQCEKCFVWQHCDCVGVKDQPEHYLCELCDPRPVTKVSLIE